MLSLLLFGVTSTGPGSFPRAVRLYKHAPIESRLLVRNPQGGVLEKKKMSQDQAEQNIQMWKVKKLIKSLDSARGCVPPLTLGIMVFTLN